MDKGRKDILDKLRKVYIKERVCKVWRHWEPTPCDMKYVSGENWHFWSGLVSTEAG